LPQDFLAGFDASKIDPSSMGEVWPLDWYKVVITDIEEKLNAAENGSYLLFTIKCIEGAYAGRECSFTLNVRNPHQQTVDISFKQISAICRCVGVLQLQARQQLYNLPFKIRIGPQKGNEIYSNVVGFQDINGNPPNKAGQAPAQGQGQAQQFAAPAPQAPAPQWGPAPGSAPQVPQYAPPPAQPAVPVQQWGAPPPGATAPAPPPPQQWAAPPAPAPAAPQQAPAAPTWGPGPLPPAPWGPPK
jgi:Protein of unknown function (DUF669)